MKIERVILIFDKEKENLLKEINADNLDISIIKKLFKETENDPYFYKPYKLEQLEYDEIVKYIPELEAYSYKKFDLYLEAVTV